MTDSIRQASLRLGFVLLALSFGGCSVSTDESADEEVGEQFDDASYGARAPVCGNGVCSGGETCSSCAKDCGVCPVVCGDGKCSGSETCSTCAGDCGVCPAVCGDGACNGSETCSTCAADCGACTNDCTVDSDCVPATCCHADSCVPASQAPVCNVACDTGCQPNTMDCGGYCLCQAGQCAAVLANPI